ncbi:hypothetical protein DBT_2086 [Dissulfuribacter thermophilus]|uniref:Thioredoxin-like fold domain-containing protein n=1 Tax=Dissulfuribacter thermophilus TaxID=1156395 RepID=A0A1B9F3Y3_9BACT|nr:thioredoxin family protein [Dissulfuribacter thermophilus]OCC14544.1 hypothetical protein DBT_2086 [Dissulfuribacter thermophilus]
MKVRIIHLEKCNSTSATEQALSRVAEEMGITVDMEDIVIHNMDDAQKYRHIGSPTVQINDLDIDQAAREITQFGLT